MWFICFVRLFICSFFSTFKRLIMFDSMSRIPCTLLGQKNNTANINKWIGCFILNSKFDSLWHFLIPQNSSFLIFRPHPFPPLSLQTYSIYPFTGNFVLDKKQNRVLPHSAIHKRYNLVLRISDFGWSLTLIIWSSGAVTVLWKGVVFSGKACPRDITCQEILSILECA